MCELRRRYYRDQHGRGTGDRGQRTRTKDMYPLLHTWSHPPNRQSSPKQQHPVKPYNHACNSSRKYIAAFSLLANARVPPAEFYSAAAIEGSQGIRRAGAAVAAVLVATLLVPEEGRQRSWMWGCSSFRRLWLPGGFLGHQRHGSMS